MVIPLDLFLLMSLLITVGYTALHCFRHLSEVREMTEYRRFLEREGKKRKLIRQITGEPPELPEQVEKRIDLMWQHAFKDKANRYKHSMRFVEARACRKLELVGLDREGVPQLQFPKNKRRNKVTIKDNTFIPEVRNYEENPLPAGYWMGEEVSSDKGRG